jgi:hypothetical protein
MRSDDEGIAVHMVSEMIPRRRNGEKAFRIESLLTMTQFLSSVFEGHLLRQSFHHKYSSTP